MRRIDFCRMLVAICCIPLSFAHAGGEPDGRLAAIAKEVRDHLVTLRGPAEPGKFNLNTLDGMVLAIRQCHVDLYGAEPSPANGGDWSVKDVAGLSLNIGQTLWGVNSWDARLLTL